VDFNAARAIKWIDPLNNRLESGVDGMGLTEISDLAKKTLDVAKKINRF
jgi:hypothetical protein